LSERFLIYGATGYTGQLLAEQAARRGLDVVLAGRSAGKLAPVAARLGLEPRVADLRRRDQLEAALADVDAVLHVAGPFAETSRPMVDACLATRTHYLDVTGELEVFEAIARRDDEARAAGVTLLPGVGFDVVPSDCLAAHVAARLESPTRLRIAIAGLGGGASRGTAKSAIGMLAKGLQIRSEGILATRPLGSLERHFDFGAGPARALAMPLGDVSTAFHTTGIPNIEVYVAMSGRLPGLMRTARLATPLLGLAPVQHFLKRRIDRGPEGPSEAERDATRCLILAEAEAPGEGVARALLETPSGYALTRDVGVEAARRVAAGDCPPGFQTPGRAFGADFILEFEGCLRSDLD
jgi:short subunit dehydrogenase-like uncharacterized protein